jgi:copper(I)-binding protein
MTRILALAAVLLLAACSRTEAHGYKLGDLAVGHPWSRPAAQGMNGAGYLTITNTGAEPDTLIAVESPAAARVEIHEGSTASGVMRMQALPEGLPIAPGATVTLKPGGAHLMLIGLTAPLKADGKAPATLVFKRAGRLAVEFKIQRLAPENHTGH